jgi:hypothetical protein
MNYKSGTIKGSQAYAVELFSATDTPDIPLGFFPQGEHKSYVPGDNTSLIQSPNRFIFQRKSNNPLELNGSIITSVAGPVDVYASAGDGVNNSGTYFYDIVRCDTADFTGVKEWDVIDYVIESSTYANIRYGIVDEVLSSTSLRVKRFWYKDTSNEGYTTSSSIGLVVYRFVNYVDINYVLNESDLGEYPFVAYSPSYGGLLIGTCFENDVHLEKIYNIKWPLPTATPQSYTATLLKQWTDGKKGPPVANASYDLFNNSLILNVANGRLDNILVFNFSSVIANDSDFSTISGEVLSVECLFTFAVILGLNSSNNLLSDRGFIIPQIDGFWVIPNLVINNTIGTAPSFMGAAIKYSYATKSICSMYRLLIDPGEFVDEEMTILTATVTDDKLSLFFNHADETDSTNAHVYHRTFKISQEGHTGILELASDSDGLITPDIIVPYINHNPVAFDYLTPSRSSKPSESTDVGRNEPISSDYKSYTNKYCDYANTVYIPYSCKINSIKICAIKRGSPTDHLCCKLVKTTYEGDKTIVSGDDGVVTYLNQFNLPNKLYEASQLNAYTSTLEIDGINYIVINFIDSGSDVKCAISPTNLHLPVGTTGVSYKLKRSNEVCINNFIPNGDDIEISPVEISGDSLPPYSSDPSSGWMRGVLNVTFTFNSYLTPGVYGIVVYRDGSPNDSNYYQIRREVHHKLQLEFVTSSSDRTAWIPTEEYNYYLYNKLNITPMVKLEDSFGCDFGDFWMDYYTDIGSYKLPFPNSNKTGVYIYSQEFTINEPINPAVIRMFIISGTWSSYFKEYSSFNISIYKSVLGKLYDYNAGGLTPHYEDGKNLPDLTKKIASGSVDSSSFKVLQSGQFCYFDVVLTSNNELNRLYPGEVYHLVIERSSPEVSDHAAFSFGASYKLGWETTLPQPLIFKSTHDQLWKKYDIISNLRMCFRIYGYDHSEPSNQTFTIPETTNLNIIKNITTKESILVDLPLKKSYSFNNTLYFTDENFNHYKQDSLGNTEKIGELPGDIQSYFYPDTNVNILKLLINVDGNCKIYTQTVNSVVLYQTITDFTAIASGVLDGKEFIIGTRNGANYLYVDYTDIYLINLDLNILGAAVNKGSVYVLTEYALYTISLTTGRVTKILTSVDSLNRIVTAKGYIFCASAHKVYIYKGNVLTELGEFNTDASIQDLISDGTDIYTVTE